MTKNHLAMCGLALAAAAVVVVVSGASTASLGVFLVALVCPLTMVVAMRLLMGPPADQRAGRAVGADRDEVLT